MTDLSIQSGRQAARSGKPPALTRIEGGLAVLVGALAATCVTVAALTGQQVHWSSFAAGAVPALGLMLVGIYARVQAGRPQLALLAIANSLYLAFTAVTTLLIYLRFPVTSPVLDPMLIEIDAMLGYSWPGFVETVAAWPTIAWLLGWIYLSSLVQLLVLVGYLALTNRPRALSGALLTGSLSLVLTTAIWWIAPSVGPAAFFDIPQDTQAAMGLVTDGAYGAYLRDLVQHGLPVIRAQDIVGTIAFPSYHTVMALLVVWYLRGTRLFWPALAVNAAMMPAILSHGGHHLVDVAGGFAVFGVAAWASTCILRRWGPSPAED